MLNAQLLYMYMYIYIFTFSIVFVTLLFWIFLVQFFWDYTGLAGVRCPLRNFPQFSSRAKPITQFHNFPWSNPTPFTENSQSKFINTVTCFDALGNWPVSIGSFSLHLGYWKQQKIWHTHHHPIFPTFSRLSLHLHFYFSCIFIFDVPSFCCLAYQFCIFIFDVPSFCCLAYQFWHILFVSKFRGSAYWYVIM